MTSCKSWWSVVAAVVLLASLASAPASHAAAQKPAAPKPPVAAACKPGSAAAKPADIKLLGAEVPLFSATDLKASVDLPLLLPPELAAGDLTVKTLQVRHDKRVDASLAGHFNVSERLLPAAGDKVPRLHVEITAITSLRPGTYQLLLAFDHRCLPVNPMSVSLERPAAALQPPGKLSLDLIVPIGFGWASATPVPASYPLRWVDDNPHSALRGVRANEGPFLGSGGRAAMGSLGVQVADTAASAPLVLRWAPRGFEVGVATGKVELLSPDLKSPMSFDVEVRTRLRDYWIAVFVLGGIGLGFLVRVVLQGRIELLQARTDGAKVVADLAVRLADFHDPELLAATDPELRALARAVESGSAAEIQGLVASAPGKVQAAIDHYGSRQSANAAKLALLRRLPAGVGQLPAPMQQAVEALDKPLDEAAALAERGNAVQAKQKLEAAHAAVVQVLRNEWPRWQRQLLDMDAEVSQLHDLFDPSRDVARGLDAVAGRFLAAELEQRDGVPKEPDFDDLASLARALDEWRLVGTLRRGALRRWAEYLSQDGERFAAELALRLDESAQLKELAAWLDAMAHADEALKRAAEGDDPYAPVMLEAGPLLRATDALLRALVAARADLSDEQRDAVAQSLRSSEYFAALVEVPPLPVGKTKARTSLGLLPAPTRRHGFAPQGGAGATEERTDPKKDAPPPTPVVDVDALKSIASRSAWQLAQAQGWRTGIVAGATLGAAYVFFVERFIGTPTELMGLFFWGLTADVSVAGLWAMAGSVGAKLKA